MTSPRGWPGGGTLPNRPRTPAATTRARRAFLRTVSLIAFVYLATEGLVLAGLLVVEGPSAFSLPVLEREDVPGRREEGRKRQVVHPYMGWVLNPRYFADDPATVVNEFGFIDDGPAIQQRSDDKLIIGIFGGSVAKHFGWNGGLPVLESILRSAGVVGEREITFVTNALPGHKQPQQLMALSYLLAVEAEFDVVINLDGFNEVAFAFQRQSAVAPPFPRKWDERVTDLPNPVMQKIVGELAYLRRRQREWNEPLSRWPWRFSPTVSLVRLLNERVHQQRIVALQFQLEDRAWPELGYEAIGPDHWPAEREPLTRALVGIWARSSRQMHHLAEGNGALYFHFLQPNQYVPKSKPFSREELRSFYDPESRNSKSVREGYPLLRQAGVGLVVEGVRFHDLTMVYADHSDTLYEDKCCHVGRAGNQIMAEAIGSALVPVLRSR